MQQRNDANLPIESTDIERVLAQRAAFVSRLDSLCSDMEQLVSDVDDTLPDNAWYLGSRSTSDRAPKLIMKRLCEQYSAAQSEDMVKATGKRYKQISFVEQFQREYDAALWITLLERTGFKGFMDRKAYDEFMRSIEQGQYPEFTAESVFATFKQIAQSKDEYFDRMVMDAFKRLSWCHKTNSPARFKQKAVYRYWFSYWGYGSPSIEHRQQHTVHDLDKLLHVLSGEPERDMRHGLVHEINEAVEAAGTRSGSATTKWFDFKWFKNNNIHIAFKDAELVAKLNREMARIYGAQLAE